LRDKVRTALTGPALDDTGMFDRRTITKLLDEHQSGVRDHATVLWSLLMFESFLRQVHEGRATEMATAGPGYAAVAGGE
jgi:asparagine synthase (glutamine-hydrolysing)